MRFLDLVAPLVERWNRVRGLFHRNTEREDVAAELRFHHAQLVEDLVRQGHPANDASRLATLRLGGTANHLEAAGDAWRLGLLESLATDTRFAMRQWRRTPVVAAVAIASIALGAGLNAGMFAVVNAALLRSLPVREPSELRVFTNGDDAPGTSSYPFPAVMRLRERSGPDVRIAGIGSLFYMSAERAGTPVLAPHGAALVTGNYFEVLGVGPAVGRVLQPSDEDIGTNDHVAVLSHAYWRGEFGGDSTIVGRDVRFNGVMFRVVGVAPAGFFGTQSGMTPDAWFPITAEDALFHRPVDYRQSHTNWWVQMIGRVDEGQDIATVESRLTRELQAFNLEMEGPDPSVETRKWVNDLRVRLDPGHAGFGILRERYERPLQLLLALSIVVLLITSANVTSLLLGRLEARRREFAVRAALGASRRRLARQLGVEGVILALLGSALGLMLLMAFGNNVRCLLFPGTQALQFDFDMDLTGAAGLIGGLAILVTGLSIVPALFAGRAARDGAFGQRADGAVAGRPRAGRVLSVFQFALAVPLVACALLLGRSIFKLRDVSLGYDPAGVTLVRVDATRNDYSLSRVVSTYRRVLDEFAAMPGVEATSAVMYAALSGSRSGNTFNIDGASDTLGTNNVQVMYVDPGYFRTFGVTLRAGREFTRSDDPRERGLAVVSEGFARRHFGSVGQAIGRRLWRLSRNDTRLDIEIVGVAPDARLQTARDVVSDVVYQPFLADSNNVRFATLAVRSPQPTSSLEPQLRRAIATADPRLEVLGIRSFADQANSMLAVERMVSRLTLLFGGLALLLSALGVYGVFAHDVARRRHEIGVRLALGATPATIRSWVLGSAAWLLALGTAIGIPLAVGATRATRVLLYDVTPGDPLTVAGVAVLLGVTLLLAVWAPSRRAARTDPLTTIRAE